jgi:hypothetical protein
MLRQGDVLLIPCTPGKTDLTGAKQVPADAGRVILARGEATGHHHSVASRVAALWVLANGMRLLQVREATRLDHQEHAPIDLPVGDWLVKRQREYTPESPRQVAD